MIKDPWKLLEKKRSMFFQTNPKKETKKKKETSVNFILNQSLD
jgi:hypothetical protein